MVRRRAAFTTREYTLTDLGRSLRPVLDAMEAWGKAYQENAR